MVIIRDIQRLQCTFGEFEDSVQKVCFSIKEIWKIYITALNYTDNKFYPHIAVYEKCTFGEVGGNRRQRGLRYLYYVKNF